MGFASGFKTGWDIGTKFNSGRDLEELEEERKKAKINVTEKVNTQDMNKGGWRVGDGPKDSMGGMVGDGTDGAAKGLVSGEDYGYMGTTFDRNPNQYDKDYAYQSRRAAIFDKYGMGERADSATRMGLASRTAGTDLEFKNRTADLADKTFDLKQNEFAYNQEQDRIANDLAERRVQIQETSEDRLGKLADAQLEEIGLRTDRLREEAAAREAERNLFNNVELANDPDAWWAEYGRINRLNPNEMQEIRNNTVSLDIKKELQQIQKDTIDLNKIVTAGDVDGLMKWSDRMHPQTKSKMIEAPDGTRYLMEVDPKTGEYKAPIGWGKTDRELVESAAATINKLGVHNIAMLKKQAEMQSAKLSGQRAKAEIVKLLKEGDKGNTKMNADNIVKILSNTDPQDSPALIRQYLGVTDPKIVATYQNLVKSGDMDRAEQFLSTVLRSQPSGLE